MDRLDKMEQMVRKACHFDEAIDLQSLFIFLKARLPPEFKMLSLYNFDGVGYITAHLKL